MKPKPIKILLPLLLLFTMATSGFGQKIYQAENSDSAKLKVYPAEEPNEADLWVCFVWEEADITKTGLLMDMRFMREADIVIFFVDEESEADLKIWLVDTPEESKWLTEKKKHLLKLKSDKNN